MDSSDNAIVDKLWKGEAIPNSVLWERYWDTSEEDARKYVSDRWYSGRFVRQNHVTRKLKRFWPAISRAVQMHHDLLERDGSVKKAWRVYSYTNDEVFSAYVLAGNSDEAINMTNFLMPRITDANQYVELVKICPADILQSEVDKMNLRVLQSVSEKIRHSEDERERAIQKHNSRIAEMTRRKDAIMILMAGLIQLSEANSENSEVSA